MGDAVNSLHNNKLGLLYSGKDSYELMQKYFTSQQDADTSSILQQLAVIQHEGVQLPAGQEEQPAQSVGVKYYGGGDGKFQSEQGGLNGHAGTYPCGRCECHKSYLHLKKADLQQRCPDLQRRSLIRCRMLAQGGELRPHRAIYLPWVWRRHQRGGQAPTSAASRCQGVSQASLWAVS